MNDTMIIYREMSDFLLLFPLLGRRETWKGFGTTDTAAVPLISETGSDKHSSEGTHNS